MTKREAVCELRKHMGLTMQAFAKRVRLTDATVSHWETGRNGIHPFHLPRLRTLARRSGAPQAVVEAFSVHPEGEARP